MAENKPIVISMKMLADVKDADKLLKYVHELGQQLKKAGGEDAEGLRRKLLQIKKEIYSSDRSESATRGFAGQIRSLMPDIAKSKTLGSLKTIDAKITGGGFQADSLRKTVADMQKAVQSGKMSKEAIEEMSKSLEKFVETANELPPEGLKELSGSILKVVNDTRELQSVMAEINEIDFDLGELKGLQRIEAAEGVKGLEQELKNLEENLNQLDDKNAEAVASSIKRIRDILSKPLGTKSIKELEEELKRLGKTADRLSGKELSKVSDSIKGVTSQGESLTETFSKTGNSLIDNLDPVGAVSEAAGLRVSGLTRTVVGLAGKIPLIGAAIKALPVGWVLAIVGAIVAAVDIVIDHMKDLEKEDAENKFKNAEQTLDGITKEIERQNYLRDLAYRKERNIVEALRDQQDAVVALSRAQDELNRAKDEYGLLSEEDKALIGTRYDALAAEKDKDNSLRRINRENEDADIEIARLKKELLAQEKAVSKYKEQARYNQGRANEAADKAGTLGQTLKDRFGLSGEDYKARSEQYNDLAQRANEKREQATKRIEEIKQEIVKQGNIKKLSDSKVATVLTKFQQDQVAIRDREFAIERERKINLNERAREEELFTRGRQDEERSYLRQKEEPWQGLNQHLKNAQKEYERLLGLEEEAFKAREKVLRDFANRRLKNGKPATVMTAEEQAAFSNATQDLANFRSARFQEQSNIDQLKKRMYDRSFDESFTQYRYAREDEDWSRSGRYERSSWAGKLRMDIDRYREGKKMFEEAQSQITADNNGSVTLTPEQRRIAERARDEGREKMTSTRDSIRSAALNGDTAGMNFIQSLMGHQNRLTRMGLGGDVGNWDKQTASNTKKLVEQNKELLNSVKNRVGMQSGWGL